MAAEVWEQNCRIFIFEQLLNITVADDPLNCFIEHTAVLCHAEPIDKDKVCVSVNHNIAFDTKFLLIFLLLTETWQVQLVCRGQSRGWSGACPSSHGALQLQLHMYQSALRFGSKPVFFRSFSVYRLVNKGKFTIIIRVFSLPRSHETINSVTQIVSCLQEYRPENAIPFA